MDLTKNTGHKHKWSEPFETKVMLRSHDPRIDKEARGTISGYDLLTQQQCTVESCTAINTINLERIKG